MDNLKEKAPLLLVLIALVTVKFVIVPIFEWQDEKLVEIQTKERQLSKTISVIDREPLVNDALALVKKSTLKQLDFYYSEPSMDAFKLVAQQNIESIFLTQDLKVTNFNWANEIEGDISEVRAKVSFEGRTKDLASLQLELTLFDKLFNVPQFNIYVERMKTDSLGKARGTMTIVLYNAYALDTVKVNK